MRKAIIFITLLLTFSFALIAQEVPVEEPVLPENETTQDNSEIPAESTEPKEPEIKTEEDYVYKTNQPGDWFIKVGINGGFPIQPETMKFGLDLNLGFYYFFSHFFAVGGDVSFDYNPTVGEKVFYCIPFMAKGVFQYTLGKFEIPLFLGLGGAIERHNSNFYFGMIIKPEIGLFYRFNPDWSIGATCGVSIMPQWYKNSEYNYTGYILNAGVSVRYHL